MLTGTTDTFYRIRRLWLVLLIGGPALLLLAGAVMVSRAAMLPRIPTTESTAGEWVRFFAHPDGLDRLEHVQRMRLLNTLASLMRNNPAFVVEAGESLRRLPVEEQRQLRIAIFDTIKPVILEDVNAFHELRDDAKNGFLDQRIIHYRQLAYAWGQSGLKSGAFDGLTNNPQEFASMLVERTTTDEFERGKTYVLALARRVEQINADPNLKAEIEMRIDGVE